MHLKDTPSEMDLRDTPSEMGLRETVTLGAKTRGES